MENKSFQQKKKHQDSWQRLLEKDLKQKKKHQDSWQRLLEKDSKRKKKHQDSWQKLLEKDSKRLEQIQLDNIKKKIDPFNLLKLKSIGIDTKLSIDEQLKIILMDKDFIKKKKKI